MSSNWTLTYILYGLHSWVHKVDTSPIFATVNYHRWTFHHTSNHHTISTRMNTSVCPTWDIIVQNTQRGYSSYHYIRWSTHQCGKTTAALSCRKTPNTPSHRIYSGFILLFSLHDDSDFSICPDDQVILKCKRMSTFRSSTYMWHPSNPLLPLNHTHIIHWVLLDILFIMYIYFKIRML